MSSYGDMELFLAGIELSSLVPLFKQHDVSFPVFLRLTDSDLQKMGIEQIGIRKKILDTIRDTHKKNWETSSLASLQYNKKISCSEAVVMLANIRQHAAYIASTIGYIDDQIVEDTRIVTEASQDRGVGVKDLCINTEEAMTNVKNLYTELSSLRRHLEKMCFNRDFKPPELVSSRRSRSRSRWRSRWSRAALFAVFVVGCSTAFVMLGKTDNSVKIEYAT